MRLQFHALLIRGMRPTYVGRQISTMTICENGAILCLLVYILIRFHLLKLFK